MTIFHGFPETSRLIRRLEDDKEGLRKQVKALAKENEQLKKEVKKSKALRELGQRAVDYYLDTGLCVFCDADDVNDIPHDDCDVGKVSKVKVTAERKAKKAEQRAMVDAFLRAHA